ncbi:Sel1 repeat containing 1 [Seminavis robusta]|uniref:Sel1 repeat containing 1 n=1 Tax=Seminavis robusta TaxID=568900 RepID=A0A9N8ELF4_9STRA|nr:Sel1 repeat containing 1 [Seminavis robusta]|eukprot:Sro1394_g268960.1 Sel1 repeat containing 1 (222) ;mRNA; r:19927-20592
MDEDHFLASFLGEKLPTLGLDPETYGPYLLGLLPADDEALLDGNDVDDNNSGADDEEWDGVLELLQASSESHSDDVDAWQALKKELQDRYRTHLVEAKNQKAEEDAQRLEAAKIAAAAIPEETKKEEKKSSVIDEEAKKAMLARFAYENDDEDEDEEGELAHVNVNKEAAKQQSLENAKELRKVKGQTKKEEQQKTKQAKQDKIKLKEERRNRANKGERKR